MLLDVAYSSYNIYCSWPEVGNVDRATLRLVLSAGAFACVDGVRLRHRNHVAAAYAVHEGAVPVTCSPSLAACYIVPKFAGTHPMRQI